MEGVDLSRNGMVEQRVDENNKFDYLIERSCEQDVFCRGDAPLERRILGVLLYHAEFSYCTIESVGECWLEAHVLVRNQLL